MGVVGKIQIVEIAMYPHLLKYATQVIDVNEPTLDLIFVAITFLITGHLTRRVIMSVIMSIGGIVITAVLLVIKVPTRINLTLCPIRVPINYLVVSVALVKPRLKQGLITIVLLPLVV